MRQLSPKPAAVASSILLVVAACSSKQEPAPNASEAEETATAATGLREEKIVNVYNWADYIDPALLEKFTAETGIRR